MAHQVTIHYGTASFTWLDFVTCATVFVCDYGHLNRSEDLTVTRKIYRKLRHGLDTHFASSCRGTVEALHDKQNQGTIAERLVEEWAGYMPLLRSKGLQATEPRDQAYAMLWVFRDFKSADLTTSFHQVDYKKSIETIYTEYAVTLMRSRLDVLFLLPLVNSTPRNQSLPSWVPDWNEVTSRSYYRWTIGLASHESSKPSRLSGAYVNFELIGSKSLRAWGIEHSKIKTVIRQNHDKILYNKNFSSELDLFSAKYLHFSRAIRDVINVGRTIFSMDDDKLIKVLYGAMVGVYHEKPDVNNFTEGQANDFHIFSLLTPLIDQRLSSPEIQRLKESLRPFCSEEAINTAFHELEQEQDQHDLSPFLDISITLLTSESYMIDLLSKGVILYSDKEFFVTESGDIGMAYHGVQEGDLVTIWRGCPCPMVVRKKEVDGMEAYHFHAMAYVDGIMNGEAWPETEEGLREFMLV